MRLSSLDIRKQEFTRGFRGYEQEEVQAFLQMMSNQWQEMLDDHRRLEDRVRELEGKLIHYEKVEEALQEALQTARESSRKAVENAEQKARLIVDQAESRAEEVKREAEFDRHQIKRETAKLSGRRNEIVARLRAFLMSEMELLARFEGDDPIGFIKLLPAEESRHQNAGELGPGRREEGRSERDWPAEASHGGGEHDLPGAGSDAENQGPVEGRSAFVHEEPEAEAMPGQPESAEATEGRMPRVRWQEENAAYEAGSESGLEEEQDVDASAYAAQMGQQEDAADEEEPPQEEIRYGPGWTARTVVSRPSEGRSGTQAREEEQDEDEQNITATSEEIEKIRRILSDLE